MPPTPQTLVSIYALRDPRKPDEIRYVGKAKDPIDRFRRHVKHNDKERYKCRWIKTLLDVGVMPELVILQIVEEGEWVVAEQQWIAHYRNLGMKLTNLTEGGDGIPFTPEIRKKISQTKLGTKASDITKAKMSAVRLGKKQTPEHRANIGKGLKGRVPTQIHRERLSQASKAWWARKRQEAAHGT
jgi:hypothetical protein